jgi:glycosyltransferase involved in cell wall biosynthesis
MKVAVIEPSGNLYGSEFVLLDILKNLDTIRFDVKVFLPKSSLFSTVLSANKIELSEVLPSAKSKRIYKIYDYLVFSLALIRFKPDVIFINQAGILRPIQMINSLFIRVKIVCEVSTLEDAYWVNSLEKSYHKDVSTFISNSHFIDEKLTVTPEKKSIVYYGYHYKGLISETNTDKIFKIALLGRISESKGHFLLVKAASLLLDLPIRFYIIGNAPTPDVNAQFLQLIKDYSLEDRFIIRGYQTNIAEEIKEMKAMVIPSMMEPFGRIFCEAAEANIPTVVSDAGGLGELSARFDVGIRFKSGDPGSLAHVLRQMYDNYDKISPFYKIQAASMLNALDMDEYIEQIEIILDRAYAKKDTSLNWTGKIR